MRPMAEPLNCVCQYVTKGDDMKRFMIPLTAVALAGCATEPAAMPVSAPVTPFSLVAPEGNLSAFFDCVRENDAVILSGHRGAAVPGYPENAIETFENTLGEIPALLEIDVQKSRDGVLVLMHDDTLARTTTGSGEVRNMTISELKSLNLVDEDGDVTDFRIPTLEEALSWGEGRTILALDRKADTTYQDLVDVVAAREAFGRVVFATYSLEDAAHVALIAPEAMIVTPIEKPEDLDTLRATGVDLSHVISWGGTEVPDPELYAQLAAQGVESAFAPLGSWTGSWDNRIRMLGDDTLYRRITQGVHLVATDRAREVAAVLPGVARAEVCTRP